LQLNSIRISAELVREHERMLTGGFYAEVELVYDAAIAQEASGRPFGVEGLRAIQLSKRDVLDTLARARALYTSEEWKAFLLRSIGLEPEALSERNRDVILLRMIPFVERNYNMVELGPRGTGKSHLFQQGLALRPSHLWRQGDGRAHVSSTTPLASAGSSASTTSCASTRFQASPSTRRTASTS
jgi:ATP-dependent Lon protease